MIIRSLLTIVTLFVCYPCFAQDQVNEKELKRALPGQRQVRTIDLEKVLSMAGANNLRIAEMEAQRQVAVARHKQASDWLLPDVSVGINFLQHNGYDQETGGELIDVGKNNGFAGAGVGAEWDIGKAVYEKKAAEERMIASSYEVAKAKRNQQLSASQAYVELVAAQSKLATFEKMITRSQDIARQLDVLVEEGIRYKSDWAMAKANINNLKLELNKARRQFLQSSNRLVQILNMDKDSVLLMSSDSVMTPLTVVADTAGISLDSAYERRPEPSIYEYRQQARQMERKKVTKGMLIPSVRAGVRDGYFGSTSESGGNRLNVQAGIGWDVPLGELFYRGERKEYEARMRVEDSRQQQAKNKIRQEVMSARDQLRQAEGRMEMAREQLSFAETALEQMLERQKVGTAEPLEVFRAEEQTIKAQRNYIEAVADFNKAQYALYFALGQN